MLMMVMPALILDRPLRVIAVTLFWYLLFLVLCYTVKDPGTRRGDTTHAVEFLFSSGLINYVVRKVRYRELGLLRETHFRLDHDDLTDLRSRHDLQNRSGEYLDRELLVLTGDLDHLSLFNDYYGRSMGDKLIRAFGEACREVFGEAHTFRIDSDEVLAVVPGLLREDAVRCMEVCRSRLQGAELPERPARLTCTFGYVTGTARTPEELQAMVRLAVIYAHRAARTGPGETFGRPFDREALRRSSAESGANGSARYYERSQLTGLPAIGYFIPRCEELLREVIDPRRNTMVGVVSMTRMREFNEAFGYVQGNELIRRMGETVQAAFPRHLIAYVTGARFDLLCFEEEIAGCMERLEKDLADLHPGWALPLKAGFAPRRRGDDVSLALDRARHAYKHAKANPDAAYYYYDEKMDGEDRLRTHVVSRLEEALEQGWHRVWFQPIVRAEDRSVCALEVLSRWQDPQYGTLSPGRFIPPLEDARLVWKLDLNAVRLALAALRTMEEAGLDPLPISVNLSRCDFFDCDVVSALLRLTEESGCPRDLLRVEITESVFAENQEFLNRQVERLRAAGFQIWMVDFGSGYSSLNLLKSLNVDLVKLDMGFVRDCCTSPKNGIIVSGIAAMCRRLEVQCLVEGVETREQYACMKQLGCGMLQGYLFAPPAPLEEVLPMLKKGSKP